MKNKPQKHTDWQRKPGIEALRALAMLAEVGSVSETARRLGVSQPVISKKLQMFKQRQASGAILLQPTDASALTEAGKSIVPAIQELVARYDRILQYLRGEESSSQVVRIAAGNFAAEHYLPAAIADLRRQFDDCQFEAQVCRGRDRISGVARGKFDLAILTHDRSQILQTLRDEHLDESFLSVTTLARHPICVLALRDSDLGHELASLPEQQIVPLSRLVNWELIGPDRQSGLRRQLEQRLKGKTLYFVAEGGGWSAAKEFVRQGLGVAFVPEVTVTAADLSQFVKRRLAADFCVTDLLVHLRDESRTFVLAAKDAIVAAAKATLAC